MITFIAEKPRARSRWRNVLYGLTAAVLGSFLALLGAQAASAHAELLNTTPADGAVLEEAPSEMVLTFNEPVQLLDGSVRLFLGDDPPLVLDPRVSNTDVVASFPAGLADGSYALSYRVVSADGHPIAGAITFTIGEDAADTPVPLVETLAPQTTQSAVSALTAVEYVSLLIFTGLLIFERIVLRSTQTLSPRSELVLRYSGIGAVASSALLVPVSALNIMGGPLTALITPSVWWPGMLWAPAMVSALIALGIVIAYVLTIRKASRQPTRVLALASSLFALAAPVLIGHSQLVEPRTLIVAADLGHLFAGAFWTGGLIGLTIFLSSAFPSRKNGKESTDPILIARVVQRFSSCAIWSVLLLTVSGTIMGLMIIESIDALTTTSYGLTLLLKIGIVASIVMIAAYNRFLLLPALRTHPETAPKWRLLRRTLTYEASLLVMVLAVTGFLTNLSPNHSHHTAAADISALAETIDIDASAQQLTVAGTFTPALTGDNEIEFSLTSHGETVFPEEVVVRVSLPEHDLGPFQTVTDFNLTTGQHSAQLQLPIAGDWKIQVIARVSTFSEPIVTIPITIR